HLAHFFPPDQRALRSWERRRGLALPLGRRRQRHQAGRRRAIGGRLGVHATAPSGAIRRCASGTANATPIGRCVTGAWLTGGHNTTGEGARQSSAAILAAIRDRIGGRVMPVSAPTPTSPVASGRSRTDSRR